MNVQIPVKWLQELLALCGPEDHELRERIRAALAAAHQAPAAPAVDALTFEQRLSDWQHADALDAKQFKL